MPDIGDLEAGARRVADQIIRDAMEEGAFDPRTLPGAFRPIPGIDEPYDDHWWVRRWIQREKLTQPEIKAELAKLARERAGGRQ